MPYELAMSKAKYFVANDHEKMIMRIGTGGIIMKPGILSLADLVATYTLLLLDIGSSLFIFGRNLEEPVMKRSRLCTETHRFTAKEFSHVEEIKLQYYQIIIRNYVVRIRVVQGFLLRSH